MSRLPRTSVALAIAAIVLSGTSLYAAADGQRRANPDLPVAADGGPPAGARAAVPGGLTEQYTGITPCRVFDTRAKGAATTDQLHHFKVSGSLSAQGGSNSCGIPTWATSVAVNLTSLGDGTGYLRAGAFGKPIPGATLLNFDTTTKHSNQVTIPLCRGTSCSSAFSLKVFGRTHLVGDAVGYYTAPAWARISTTRLETGSGVVEANHLSTGRWQVVFDRPVDNCALVTSDMVFAATREISAEAVGNRVEAVVRNANGTMENTWFHLAVIC